MSIHDFIKRCDAFCDATGQSRTWLSKKLFSDTFKIENLAAGAVDIGVRRLGKACIDLELLERRREGLVVLHAETLPGRAGLGAENLERNVSRTDEPGSSASATALPHAAPAHQIAQADAIERAAGHDAVIGSATRHAGHAPSHGDVDERLPGGAAAGGVKFGRKKVGQANFDPTCPALSAQGLNAEAVAIADIDDRAGECAAGTQLGRHGAAIRDSRAGIGGGRSGEREEEGGQGGNAKHGAILEGEGYRRVSA